MGLKKSYQILQESIEKEYLRYLNTNSCYYFMQKIPFLGNEILLKIKILSSIFFTLFNILQLIETAKLLKLILSTSYKYPSYTLKLIT